MTTATNGDCQLFFERFGDPADPTLLLVNGLGSQCINYQEAWCAMFAACGLHVVRFDNRDVGLSTSFDGAPVDEHGASYRLSDMAADAVAVLDACDVDRAHVMGLSMGGMIVQTMAIEHPARLATMTSAMSRTGEPGYGGSTPEALALLLGPPATDRRSYVDGHVAGLRVWGSPEFADEDRWRADAQRAFDRAFNPAGTTRQFLAVAASGDRAAGLRGVRAPTVVIHGDRDTLIDQSGGRRTAELIPGARFELIEGMGHDYPPQLWERWVDLVATHALP
ncbi:MAG: alpha/beta hydrolase [Acidimicrobiia bacterium]|nr:alpha/beta hydrolase [Acidimicrobiia bacterium]